MAKEAAARAEALDTARREAIAARREAEERAREAEEAEAESRRKMEEARREAQREIKLASHVLELSRAEVAEARREATKAAVGAAKVATRARDGACAVRDWRGAARFEARAVKCEQQFEQLVKYAAHARETARAMQAAASAHDPHARALGVLESFVVAEMSRAARAQGGAKRLVEPGQREQPEGEQLEGEQPEQQQQHARATGERGDSEEAPGAEQEEEEGCGRLARRAALMDGPDRESLLASLD